MNILVVDDVSENVTLLKVLLEGGGYSVSTARNGREALWELEKEPIDCIVSDVLMPVMDGFQLCRACKTSNKWYNIPFIFYTATYTEKKDEEFALSLRADAYIIKPQDPEWILKVVNELIERSKMRSDAVKPQGAFRDTVDEQSYLAEHNRRLVSKLEQKMEELQTRNRELQESEAKYRLVVDNATEAILVVQDKRITFANFAAEKLFGWEGEKLRGMSFGKLVHKEDEVPKVDEVPKNGTANTFRIVTKDGEIRWVELHTSPITWETKSAVLCFLTDITGRRHAEQCRDKVTQNLDIALSGSVQAIARIIEVRDPYTAGHERRVADLAIAIAQEMHADPDTISAVKIAGMIHDIGKIAIPAEILSKPSTLSEAEYEIIHTHSQIGYQILSEIHFPWPIAEIVLQHHERLDGSGYPQGLVGDQILPIARIIGVADVVEAMASHRPYRASRGIDKALDEIAQGRGIRYDPIVVDICIRLFREQGYRLPN